MNTQPFTKTYDGRIVLDLPELHLEEGRICAVIGANGSGKSTLAQILAGTVSADGKTAPFLSRPTLGYMPQKSFAFRMSVLRNLKLAGVDDTKAQEMLEQLQLSHLSGHSAKKLSGGELARLALGRVLCGRHRLLILDEPTASMDMESTLLAEQLIVRYCREHGAAVLLITHSLAQAQRIADTALYLHHGKAVEYGPADQILHQPSQEETKRFLTFYGQ